MELPFVSCSPDYSPDDYIPISRMYRERVVNVTMILAGEVAMSKDTVAFNPEKSSDSKC